MSTLVHAHPHEHDHPGGLTHDEVIAAPVEQHHGPSHDGSVVLDIGGTIGAVVLHVPAELAGVEIDIVGMGPGATSTHSLVRPRELPTGTRFAAVYPGLPEGDYQIPSAAGFSDLLLHVTGGTVTEVEWHDR